ncbi:acetyl-CoA C-acyltransferase [Beggiatoa leptomitoformis]|uniref:Acetyl-CoA C-acyltransferase n=1 Tax=Beggiatoa leptomitoformis TaxID=288004 RepID=A0A2N9YB67_9GAMM|nr:acetyl-CoA C-acyltransferase [Beggiatoa leptomitoformis]ALG66933.1 acetyl-CoA C-acyltransferase [Beggiatoa leptomitoformis]AUI67701.1 acetyl-CoA C-acyltransferase [Beggiatoa leptomitoformis]
MTIDPIVIVSYARTAMGGFQGIFNNVSAPELGGTAIKAAVARAGLQADDIQEVLMGCVLPAGLGQAPARQAALLGGLPVHVGCTTISKVCGSGMKATMLAHDLLVAGTQDIILAGGMESMSNAPYLLPKARAGYRLGHGQIIDHMFFDGLEDAYFDKGRLMGTFAEDCASLYHFSREDQDQFAITSLHRAQKAIAEGLFQREITPYLLTDKKGDVLLAEDEQPNKANISKIPSLKPAFKKDGTVTPANSSSISDGAAALVLMRRSTAEQRGIKPLAVIHGHTTHAQAPNLFTTAPIGAINALFQKTGLTAQQIDLYEINEAFAVVTMAAMQTLQLPAEKVNVHGGACALGHPIGASGARIIVTLLAALEQYDLKMGVASLCIGGGEATAIAIERV